MHTKIARSQSDLTLLSTTRGTFHMSSLKNAESIQNSVNNTQRDLRDDASSSRIMSDSRQPLASSRLFTPAVTARSKSNSRVRPRADSSTGDGGVSERQFSRISVRKSTDESPRITAKRKSTPWNAAVQLHERNTNLNEMIDNFNIDPEKVHLPGASIDEKEAILNKYLVKQVNDQYNHHLQNQQRRDDDRDVFVRELHAKESERDMLFKKLSLDTKYKALQTKILEKVADAEYLKQHKEERIARIKKREAKLNIEEHKLQYEENQFKEMKLKVMNLDKAVSYYDLRDKERFDVACDETFTDKILEKVSKFAETHANFFEVPKANPTTTKKLQGKGGSNTPSEGAGGLGGVARDREQMMWDRYLEENFPIWEKEEKSGALRQICHHPKEFGEEYRKYIQRSIDKIKYQKEREAAAHAHTQIKAVVTKVVAPNIFKRLTSNPTNKSKISHKTALTLRKEQEPEVLKEITATNQLMNQTYRPVYDLIEWNNIHEDEFLENRRSSLGSLPIGSFGAANTITTVGFYSNNQVVRAERDKIDNKALESKKSFYFLTSNPYNSKKIQQELDTIRNEELEQIEFDVANKVLEKYKNDQSIVFKERKKYLESVRDSRKTENKQKAHSEEKKVQLLEMRKEHKLFSSQIKAILQRRVEGQITKSDDKFANSHVIQDCRDSYSKLSNLRKIVDVQTVKRRINEVMSKPYNPDEYRPITVSKSTKKLERYKPKFQQKMKRSLSGGPISRMGSEVHQKHADDEKKAMAATKIQALVKGMIARKRYYEVKDLKVWLEKRLCQIADPSEADKPEPKEEEIIEKSAEMFGRLAKRPSIIINTINLVKRGTNSPYLLSPRDKPLSIGKDSPRLKKDASPGLKDAKNSPLIVLRPSLGLPGNTTGSDDGSFNM